LVFRAEAEPVQDAAGARRGRMRIDVDEPVLHLADPVRILRCLGLGEQPRALLVGGEDGLERRGSTARRFLRHEPDANLVLQPDLAAVRLPLAPNEVEECRFTGAIPSDKPDLPAGVYLRRGALEERPA